MCFKILWYEILNLIEIEWKRMMSTRIFILWIRSSIAKHPRLVSRIALLNSHIRTFISDTNDLMNQHNEQVKMNEQIDACTAKIPVIVSKNVYHKKPYVVCQSKGYLEIWTIIQSVWTLKNIFRMLSDLNSTKSSLRCGNESC